MPLDRFQVVPSAYVLLRRDDDVLLQFRSGTGYYDDHWASGAAGHVEAGESVFEAARREAAEELGVSIAVPDLRPVTVMHRTGGSGAPVDERIDLFFECRTWTGVPRLLEEKASALDWFPLASLPRPVVPYELRVLEGLRDRDLPPVVSYGFTSIE